MINTNCRFVNEKRSKYKGIKVINYIIICLRLLITFINDNDRIKYKSYYHIILIYLCEII